MDTTRRSGIGNVFHNVKKVTTMALVVIDDSSLYATASAIRSKAGVQDLFQPSQMASAVLAIPTGGGSAVLGSKSITSNGTYYASADSFDGYDEVVVNVSGGSGGDVSSILDIIVGGASGSIYNDTLSSIRNYAFASHGSLTAFTGTNVTTIGTYAFGSCSTLSSVDFPKCETIGFAAFSTCTSLDSVIFPSCVTISEYGFQGCTNLTTVEMPECQLVSNSAFSACINLSQVSIPKCSVVRAGAFSSCKKLKTISLPSCNAIWASAFYRCEVLESVYLLSTAVAALSNSNAFAQTRISQLGYIYVPSSLYNDYIVATNWSYFASRITSYVE